MPKTPNHELTSARSARKELEHELSHPSRDVPDHAYRTASALLWLTAAVRQQQGNGN